MISGANRGIGKAIALALYHQGFCVSLGIRDLGNLDDELKQLSEERTLIHYYDALIAHTANAWIEDTQRKFSQIDGLVNNAGIYHALDVEEANEALLDELIAINIKAPVRLSRLVLPYLRQSDAGRIINLVSDGAKNIKDSKVGYSISKAGFLAASQAMFQAAQKDGVRVTALCPAWVNTDMAKNRTSLTPQQMIQPETIAHLVLMLIDLPNNAVITELDIQNIIHG